MASTVPPYVSPPLGLNYILAVEPCFTFVLISLPLSSMLVPILFLMIFSSTKDSRKTLLFSLNILIVLLGIVEGILSTTVQVRFMTLLERAPDFLPNTEGDHSQPTVSSV